jgi:hypothetical protein
MQKKFTLEKTIGNVTTLTSFEVFPGHVFTKTISFKTQCGVKSDLVVIEASSKSLVENARLRYKALLDGGYVSSDLDLNAVQTKLLKINGSYWSTNSAHGGLNND